MDNQSNPQSQDNHAEASSGCCGGKSKAQAHDKVEQRETEATDTRPASSGCRCGQN